MMTSKPDMSKEAYMELRGNHSADIMPVLHAYYNWALPYKDKRLTFDEFVVAWSHWIDNPIIMISMSRIIEQVFFKMDRIYGIE